MNELLTIIYCIYIYILYLTRMHIQVDSGSTMTAPAKTMLVSINWFKDF